MPLFQFNIQTIRRVLIGIVSLENQKLEPSSTKKVSSGISSIHLKLTQPTEQLMPTNIGLLKLELVLSEIDNNVRLWHVGQRVEEKIILRNIPIDNNRHRLLHHHLPVHRDTEVESGSESASDVVQSFQFTVLLHKHCWDCFHNVEWFCIGAQFFLFVRSWIAGIWEQEWERENWEYKKAICSGKNET